MIRNLWPLLIGFTIWAVAFLAIYSIQALGCVWSWPGPWHRTLLLATIATTLIVLAVVIIRQLAIRKSNPSSIQTAGVALTLAAIVASVLTFGPTLFVTTCI